ncbi:biotin-dependent carboxyltransferase family protein [Pseudooceanicola sp. HF7]|uniref:5-oxoprolinase subunit C family protein n=1 Tax=Pseudooceanicola sp. HF7 TaxID=2721560 RepID=UPI001430423D|nr:biotin-dependent carboxyltransferase family protein [Pseudooceanicola sp. HF7]NIZ07834.1 urea amidolyase [Pseudooceanicola sp. HF7]
MSAHLRIETAGPGLTVQDLGRPGLGAQGLSRGGALDRLALFEAAALLRSPEVLAGIEMPGMGGSFTVDAPMRLALTGAPMRATLNGRPLAWHAAHPVQPGDMLKIGPVESGTTGYLTPAGGIATRPVLASRATHLAVRIGSLLEAGTELPVGEDPAPARPPCLIRAEARFDGGVIRVLAGPQTDLFSEAQRAAFAAASFTRGTRSNRQAMQLLTEDHADWHLDAGGLASEPIQAGDLQITGDGTPFMLLAECQTIGGYPRIGSVHPADMARMAQAGNGAVLRFRFTDWDRAEEAWTPESEMIRALAGKVSPLVRDPADIPDLLSYQLVSGVTAGRELD